MVAFRADMDAVASDFPDPVEFRSLTPGVRHICGHPICALIQGPSKDAVTSLKAKLDLLIAADFCDHLGFSKIGMHRRDPRPAFVKADELELALRVRVGVDARFIIIEQFQVDKICLPREAGRSHKGALDRSVRFIVDHGTRDGQSGIQGDGQTIRLVPHRNRNIVHPLDLIARCPHGYCEDTGLF